MFSGKTTELLRQINRHCIAGRTCCLIKYEGDTRYSQDYVVTHDNVFNRTIATYHEGKTITGDYSKYDVVGVDEGQFFNMREWLDTLTDTIVIVAGLNGTYNRFMFTSISDIIPICTNIVYLKAICTACGQDAIHSKRIVSGDQEELIGGSESYAASCSSCL